MIDGFVLAGGRSTRMGVDKARVALGGWPMASWTVRALTAVCDRVALVRRGGPDGLPWILPDGQVIEVLYEPDEGEVHPLWGVATALSAAHGEHALIAPCDVPDLPLDLLRELVARAPAVASDGARVHPLVAALPASWAERARALAASGASVHALVDGLVVVPFPGLRDRNRPEDVGDPVAALLAGLPWLDDEARRRVAEGEIGRLRARGALPALAKGEVEGS